MKNVLKIIISTVLFFVFSTGYSQVKPKKSEMKSQSKIEKIEVKESSTSKKNKKPELKHVSKVAVDPSKVKKKRKSKLKKKKTESKLMTASKKKN